MEMQELNLNEMEMITGGRWKWKCAVVCMVGGGITGVICGGILGGVTGAAIGGSIGVASGPARQPEQFVLPTEPCHHKLYAKNPEDMLKLGSVASMGLPKYLMIFPAIGDNRLRWKIM